MPWVVAGVRRHGSSGRLSVRVSGRMTNNGCSGLTVLSRAPDRFMVSFTGILPTVPGTAVTAEIVVAPRRTGELFFTLGSGVAGCRDRFKRVGLRDGPPGKAVPVNFNPGVTRTW